MELNTTLNLTAIQDAENVCDLFPDTQEGDEDISNIGLHVKGTFESDKSSRAGWERKYEDANELALQVSQTKTYPWPNCSNVKFPLITIAAMQFQARAYPALVKAPNLVKYRKQGKDDGEKAARADRIGAHMSWQLLEQDEGWEEHQDKALLVVPIAGCAFKKTYYDKTKGYNCSTLVLPKHLVVHYYTRSLEACERKTEIFQLSPREIRERQLRGIFRDIELPQSPDPNAGENEDSDQRQGLSAPGDAKDRAITLLEQHTYLDLDGDGYKEPYVVTVSRDTGEVYRIVNRFDEITTEQSLEIEQLQKRLRALAESLPPPGEQTEADFPLIQKAEQTANQIKARIEELATQPPKVLKIKALEYYTKIPFIPSPDGGFYDLGFGSLMGPLNESVNTLINQLIDNGSLQNGSLGFIGKGARIKGGKVRFSPNEWKRVNVAGSTLRDSLVPLPINPPSEVLFNLLSLLISYTERVGSVTDAMVGENPGQNTPAYNMSAMLEQGLQIFNGIFKRVYRSMREEFRKLYKLNSIYLDEEEYYTYHDLDNQILKADYNADPKDLIPAADPNAFSNKEKAQKAMLVAERATMVPGYNPILVEQQWLEAMDIPSWQELFPLDKEGNLVFPPQEDPEIAIKKAEEQRRTLESQVRGAVDTALAESKIMVDQAQILKLMAEAEEIADKPEYERLKLLLEEQNSIRKSLVDMAKISVEKEKIESDERTASKRVAGASGNS